MPLVQVLLDIRLFGLALIWQEPARNVAGRCKEVRRGVVVGQSSVSHAARCVGISDAVSRREQVKTKMLHTVGDDKACYKAGVASPGTPAFPTIRDLSRSLLLIIS